MRWLQDSGLPATSDGCLSSMLETNARICYGKDQGTQHDVEAATSYLAWHAATRNLTVGDRPVSCDMVLIITCNSFTQAEKPRSSPLGAV